MKENVSNLRLIEDFGSDKILMRKINGLDFVFSACFIDSLIKFAILFLSANNSLRKEGYIFIKLYFLILKNINKMN